MTRVLSMFVLSAVIIAFVATQVFAQAPVGLKWKPTSGDYTFTRVPGGAWVQTDREGNPLYYFIEVQSNTTFVEIATKSRKWSYRLYNGRIDSKTPDSPEWVRGEEGYFE